MDPKLTILCWVLLVAGASGCVSPEGPEYQALPIDRTPEVTEGQEGNQTEGTAPPASAIFRLQPSHGSTSISFSEAVSSVTIEVAGPHDSLRNISAENLSVGSQLVVPFLVANTEYEYLLKFLDEGGAPTQAQGSFRTLDNPYRWAAPSTAIIRPGSQLSGPSGSGCTLAFILRDGTNDTLYALTAGHCVGEVGQPFSIFNETKVGWVGATFMGRLSEPMFFGVAAAFEDTNSGTSDWGLIKIADSARDHVAPEIRHWTGPIGITDTEEVAYNDQVCIYGWGNYYEEAPELRHRCGTLEGFSDPEHSTAPFFEFYLSGKAQSGDSGSPVLHTRTGTALGILVGSDLRNPGITLGIPLCSIMQDLDELGFTLALATAPYDPPTFDSTYPDELAPLRDTLPETKECHSWILDRSA